ncbi:hypothetical protein LTR95_005271 [Oleoguttula sp. CCFEE 5521]
MAPTSMVTRSTPGSVTDEDLDGRLIRCISTVQRLLDEAEAALSSGPKPAELERKLAVPQLREQLTALLPTSRAVAFPKDRPRNSTPSRSATVVAASDDRESSVRSPIESDASAHKRESAAPRPQNHGKGALSMHSGRQHPSYIPAQRQAPGVHSAHRLFGVEKRWWW